MNQSKLQELLNQCKGLTKINLEGQSIGNEGVSQVCKFISENPQIQILQLKGNNIGSDGIKEIFNALQNSAVIRTVLCEWNNIGLEDEGLQAVASFLLTNQSLKYLSLAQNKIGGDSIQILANSLKNNKHLLGIDLRWNEIGSKGGEILKKAVENNETILSLDLNGNNLNDDIFEEIEEIIKKNQRKNPMSQEDIIGMNVGGENEEIQEQQPDTNSQQPEQQATDNQNRIKGQNYQTQIRDNDGMSMVHHLEQVLQQEKLHSQQIKQRLEMELEELDRKDKNSLKGIQELEQGCQDLSNQNKMIKFDIDRLRDEFNIVDKSNVEQIRLHEDRIRNNQIVIEEMDKKHKQNIDKLILENNQRVKEQTRDWEVRCKALDERIKMMDQERLALEDELKRVQEKSVDIKIKQEEDLKDLAKRVEEDEYQKFQTNLTNLETKISAIEESHDIYLKRNHDLIAEYETKDKENMEETQRLDEELANLQLEQETFVKNQGEFKLIADKLKGELDLKKTIIDKLEKEINTQNEQIEAKKKFGVAQLKRLQDEQEEERKQWQDERDQQLSRIEKLEEMLRGSTSENSKLRQEYMRLSEIVQANVNKAIFTTFTDNNYY